MLKGATILPYAIHIILSLLYKITIIQTINHFKMDLNAAEIKFTYKLLFMVYE